MRTAERLQVIEDVARDNLAEARALVSAFPPLGLDGSTLTGAVGRLVDRLRVETGLVVDVEVDGDLDRLGRDGEVVLLRVGPGGADQRAPARPGPAGRRAPGRRRRRGPGGGG